jgi:hypothetical protein
MRNTNSIYLAVGGLALITTDNDRPAKPYTVTRWHGDCQPFMDCLELGPRVAYQLQNAHQTDDATAFVAAITI